MIDSLHTEQHQLAEKARDNMHQRDKVFRISMYIFAGSMFAGLVALAIIVYSLYDTRGDQLSAINDELKTVCRTTTEKQAPALDTCSKAERGELVEQPPDKDDPESQDAEIQDPEFQDSETQEPEIQDPENQDAEDQNSEENDADPDDPEIQESEVQDPEDQDPEIDDPDPAIPGPIGPAGEDAPVITGFDIGTHQGKCVLSVSLSNGKVMNTPVPAAFCLPI